MPEKKPIEFHPDAWPRFAQFITEIAKAGPQHRAAKPKEKGTGSPKGRRTVKKPK